MMYAKWHPKNAKVLPTGPFGIVPYGEWLTDVLFLHMMAKESAPTQLGGFWKSMYDNNVSPLEACRWNYDYSPCVFTNPDYYGHIDEHRYFRFTMLIAPRYGIGELWPIQGFES